MLTLTNVYLTYGHQDLLQGVTFQVNPRERVGLVGRNGTGKTSLLRLILGQEQPRSGTIALVAGTTMGYLAQDLTVDSQNTLRDELRSAFVELSATEQQLHAQEEALAAAHSPEAISLLVKDIERLRHDFERLGGYTMETEIGKVVAGMGFPLDQLDRPVSELSGGWQMRVGFAKLLLQAPNLLLLDEPTNHLDLQTVEWLAGYLKTYRGALLIVSHDRWFLDEVCTRILELERAEVTSWVGNYSSFLQQKQEQQDLQLKAHERQQEYIQKQQAFIDRFRATPSKTRATQSREKMINKIERIDAPDKPGRPVAFKFPPATPSGRETLLIKNVTKSYPKRRVLSNVTFTLERGDRVALIGPNGSGKSTLLRLLSRSEPPDGGTITYGHNVQLAYYTQHQAETLNTSHTALGELYAAAPRGWTQEDVRSLLGRFLFHGEDVFKHISVLSGGERSRLALAKLLLQPANVLLLDEPTNHLDIPARDVLEEALAHYAGSFIVSTHDRHLLNHVTNRVIELRAGEVLLHNVGYAELMANGAQTGRPGVKPPSGAPARPSGVFRPPARKPAATSARPSTTAKTDKKGSVVQQLATAEQRVEVLEREVHAFEERIADPALYRDRDAASELIRQHQEAVQALEGATATWAALAERAAALEAAGEG